jgi:hypothetical protein
MSDDDTDDWTDYESGPFCRHWSDLGCCDDLCVCGHTCSKHGYDPCDASGCDCQFFVDKEQSKREGGA